MVAGILSKVLVGLEGVVMMCGLGRAIDRFKGLVGGYSGNFHKIFGKRFLNTAVYSKN